MSILDELGDLILDEAGGGIEDNMSGLQVVSAVLRHRDVLELLMPVRLGDDHAADIDVEGSFLDAAQTQADLLLKEMFPDTCFSTLDEWERVLGLPDACTGPLATVQQRIQAVAAKAAEKRRISATYLVEAAARLGYTITITNYSARRYGSADLGTEYAGEEWAKTIVVNAPLNTLQQRRYGSAVYGETYQIWGNTVLECALTRLKPAHVHIIFSYT